MTDRINITAEERVALQAFAERYGRKWKEELRHQWENGLNWKEPGGDALQRLRNRLGPRWLKTFQFAKIPAIELTGSAALAAADRTAKEENK